MELEAQLRALKRQGSMLSAERDNLMDVLEIVHERRDNLLGQIANLEADNQRLLASRNRLWDQCKKLFAKLKEARAEHDRED